MAPILHFVTKQSIAYIVSENQSMKKILAALILIVTTSSVVAQESFTVYLVRHAEKTESEDDPELTACGEARAESIAHFLSEEPLEAIYSTEYTRTVATATPTAGSQQLTVDFYDAGDLRYIADRLIKRSENALVVGHSNTTDELAGMLCGSDYEANPMDHEEYDRIYQVIISADSREVHLFRSTFTCSE